CKIKALRAKTNTYIKTPVRGEDSIFVVTGRKEDVIAAKQEILSAAEHFTQIRASRRHSQGGIPAPGHITAYVRVPYKFVGLVVGPKGATIKRIQQQTHTYIVTPSRDKEPVFEVTGLSENVESARREIETHIGSRTGQIFQPTAFLDTNYNGMVVPNADFDLNNHHFNQSSPSNSIHSAAASILNDFHMNGTDSLSSCGVVGVCSSNADSSIISSSYGSQTSGSSSSSSSASSNNGQIQQFSGVVGQIISKPTNNCILSAPALPTYQQQQQCGNNEDLLSANSFISSQVQIGYNAWTNSTVNLNPRTVSSNNSDINGYLLLNGAKNLHSLSTVSKCGNSTETDNNGWFRSGFVNNSASFLNHEFLTPDFCNENQPRQQIPSSGVESSAPPPPCALLPSFLSSIWSNNDNVDDDLMHNNNHHVVKYHSASLGDSQTSTTANQNCQAGTSVDLKSVA
uniref:K Homology domain-containing protein n=1 Tax=Romanomermis culicivorax TaxID=13658 RepID=A0A915JZK6_ROMCU